MRHPAKAVPGEAVGPRVHQNQYNRVINTLCRGCPERLAFSLRVTRRRDGWGPRASGFRSRRRSSIMGGWPRFLCFPSAFGEMSIPSYYPQGRFCHKSGDEPVCDSTPFGSARAPFPAGSGRGGVSRRHTGGHRGGTVHPLPPRGGGFSRNASTSRSGPRSRRLLPWTRHTHGAGLSRGSGGRNGMFSRSPTGYLCLPGGSAKVGSRDMCITRKSSQGTRFNATALDGVS